MPKKENYNDPIDYVLGILVSILLIVGSVFGVKPYFYTSFDYIFSPFFIAGRSASQTINRFFFEIANKSMVLNENIEMKKKIIELESIISENKSLREQLDKVSGETNISYADEGKLQLVEVSGIQNTFSSDPILRIYTDGSGQLKQWDPVYLEKGVLFGFVYKIYSKSADIVPFYSPKVPFNIPVRLSGDRDIKGFVENINKGKLLIRNISSKSDIKKDDIWLTSNDVLEIPPGLIIGYTIEETSIEGGFKKVSYRLPYSVQDINYLLIKA